MGESFGSWRMGDDAQAMPLIDQASLACGFHAGDPLTIQQTVRLALVHGVSIGAHPAYPDLMGFGRRHLRCTPDEVEALVLYQLGALGTFCRAEGSQLAYVKPHGALYNDLVNDDQLLRAVLRACARYCKGLPLMVLARPDNAHILQIAKELEVPLLLEAFADRAYLADGQLAPRQMPGATHQSSATILAQATAIAQGQPFASLEGDRVLLQADSLCVHGDNPQSLATLRQLRAVLDAVK